MKKYLLFLILFITILFCSCNSNPDFISTSYTIKSPDCTDFFIYNLDTEELTLYSNDNDTRVYPASITKLLTSLVALDVMSPDSIITPGNEVYLPGNNASSAYIRPHHQLTLEMLIEGMIVPSGNDAAYAVAAACGYVIAADTTLGENDAIEIFINRMNEYASEIGCTNSNFTSPDGYADSKHYSSLEDILLIVIKALNNDTIAKYIGLQCDNVVYYSGHTNTWTNTNKLLDPNSQYYNEYVTGIKTGSLNNNYSLLTLYDNGSNHVVIGVFGAKTDRARYNITNTIIDLEISP